MKTTSAWARKVGAFGVAVSIVTALTFSVSAELNLAPQISIDLDRNPNFDFSPDPNIDPLFTPELPGVSSKAKGFYRLDALRSFASEVNVKFPPRMEVFVAYWGNPGYGELAGTDIPPGPLGAASSLSIASTFRPGGG